MKDLVDCHYASLWIGRSYAFKANAITIGVCNLLWAIPTCFLNILVLIAFNKKRSLRKAGNKILISLSISDLMSGLIAQPFWIASVFVAVTTPRQKVPCWLIITTNLCGYVLACTSLLTVSFVSFERYVAIFLPFFSSRKMTSKLFYIVSASIWLVSLIIVIGFLFLELFHAFFWCNIVVIVFSYVWNIFVYVRITRQIYKVRRTVEKRHSRFSNQEAVVKSKGTQVTVAIIITLLLCYLPQVMTSIARLITHQSFVMEFMEYWAITFGLMNPGFNPLFYCYCKIEIRNKISQILRIKFDGGDGHRDCDQQHNSVRWCAHVNSKYNKWLCGRNIISR